MVETKLTPWLVHLILHLMSCGFERTNQFNGLVLDSTVSGIWLPGLGLGDIERKAIYFNQGLLAQLLTIGDKVKDFSSIA